MTNTEEAAYTFNKTSPTFPLECLDEHDFTFPQKTHMYFSGYPLKLYFQIHCVFPVQLQIFPVPIYIICDYYIIKLSWQMYPASEKKKSFTFRIREFTT